jgi:hypothetical protein
MFRMVIDLRKTPEWVHVVYKNTVWDRLLGKNIALHVEDAGLLLSVDLAGNFKKGDKGLNSYEDAHKLADDPNQLVGLRIDNMKVLERLASYYEKQGVNQMVLSLVLNDTNCVNYAVRPKDDNGNLMLEVIAMNTSALVKSRD